MCCDFHSPINCYNDGTRYTAMIVFNIFELIFFIARLGLISSDVSQRTPDTTAFLVPILLLDLIASVPIIIFNALHIITRHCVTPLTHDPNSYRCLWRFATMTCVRFTCHNHRPQAILLMRLLCILCAFMLKFICFVLGAACSARFKPVCTAYTIIAAFAFVPSILVIITEFVHFFRLWKYNPTHTENNPRSSVYGYNALPRDVKKLHRRHLGFIHHSLLNDQNTQAFRHSRCEKKKKCDSFSLYHYLLYHTVDDDHDIDLNNKSFIAFYQTNVKEALEIAQNGFPYGDPDISGCREYLHLKQSVFFTRSLKDQPFSSIDATLCCRLNLGRTKTLDNDTNMNLNEYFAYNDGECDTVYVKSTRRLYLRMPAQIEKWIISIASHVSVYDNLHAEIYRGCA